MNADRRILVWDAPLRLFHWLLAVLVVFSYVSGKIGGSWLEWHMRSGYAILTLLLFRLSWGFVGSQTARFASFVRGGRAIADYVTSLQRYGPKRTMVGHNPLGAWSIVAMLLVLLLQASTGLFVDDEISTQGPLAVKVSNALVAKMTAFHRYNQWVVVALVTLHVAVVGYYQLALHVDLLRPMLHGRVDAAGVAGPRQGSTLLAAVLVAACAGFVYWLVAVFPRSGA